MTITNSLLVLVVIAFAITFSDAFQANNAANRVQKPLKMSIEFAEKLPGG